MFISYLRLILFINEFQKNFRFLFFLRSIVQIKNFSFNNDDLCHVKYGFTHRQIRFCQKNLHLMPFIYFGTDLAIKECQNQFKNRHWNCTLFDKNRLIGNVLDSG